jgi:hypothetical protein
MMSWTGHVACGGSRNRYSILIGKPEGRRPLGRQRHIWEDNIKMDHRNTARMTWIGFLWLGIGTDGLLL